VPAIRAQMPVSPYRITESYQSADLRALHSGAGGGRSFPQN
jgi:hypothetical protein